MPINFAVRGLFWRTSRLIRHPYADIPLIFLSGVGRSGTTAVRNSIGAHPSIEYNGAENNIAYDLLELGRYNYTFPSRIAAMQMSRQKYFLVMRNTLLSFLYPHPRLAQRPLYWMISSDLTPNRADFLIKIFPKTQFVYLVRNGIEVISSRMLFKGFNKDPFQEHCRRWSLAESMCRWGEQRDNFHLIRHEQLNQPDSAKKVIEPLFLALDLPHCEMVSNTLLQNKYHPTKWYGENDCSMTGRKERWRHWTPEQRDEFVHQCRSAMSYFNYVIPWNTPENVAHKF